MLNVAGRRVPYLIGINLSFWQYDVPDKTVLTVKSLESDTSEAETGWDRLRNMYSYDEYGERSPEMHFAMQATFFGTFMGLVWGGSVNSRMAYVNFMERNQATAFANVFEAKRKLQDAVTLSFAKGAYRWAWRMGLFTGTYAFLQTSIAVYRGKSSFFEYIAAGTLTGAMYKTMLGPRAMLVGGAVGGVFGSVAGALTLTLLRVSGISMEEIRYWQYNWKTSRDKNVRGARSQVIEPLTDIEVLHDQKVKKLEAQEQDVEKSKA